MSEKQATQPQIFASDKTRYELCQMPTGVQFLTDARKIYYIRDVKNGSNSELYDAANALALLAWLSDRESAYQFTATRMRHILAPL